MNDEGQCNQEMLDRLDAIERKLDLILHKLDASVIKNCDCHLFSHSNRRLP
jgi:hypothetical protein